jgi:2-oxo-4-hydroxy-4-carboxy--5-ureidoimidazoline (OHCU) decarboxylase
LPIQAIDLRTRSIDFPSPKPAVASGLAVARTVKAIRAVLAERPERAAATEEKRTEVLRKVQDIESNIATVTERSSRSTGKLYPHDLEKAIKRRLAIEGQLDQVKAGIDNLADQESKQALQLVLFNQMAGAFSPTLSTMSGLAGLTWAGLP